MFGLLIMFLSVSGYKIEPILIYPEAVAGAQMVCEPDGVCYSFSGEGNSFFSNMLILNSTKTFENFFKSSEIDFKISSSSVFPSDRRMYGMFLISSIFIINSPMIYIFGGVGANGILNDMWAYYIKYDFWVEIEQKVLIPARFDFASQVMDDLNSFAVVGGMGENNEILEDAWK